MKSPSFIWNYYLVASKISFWDFVIFFETFSEYTNFIENFGMWGSPKVSTLTSNISQNESGYRNRPYLIFESPNFSLLVGVTLSWKGHIHFTGNYILIKFGLLEKHTKFEKNLSHGFDKSADLLKGQTNSKWLFQAEVSSKKRTNEFNFTTMIPLV